MSVAMFDAVPARPATPARPAKHARLAAPASLARGVAGPRRAGVLALAVLAGAASAQTAQILMRFDGRNLTNSGFVPPDTMGAIGPDHFVQLINGAYAVYRRDGVLVEALSLDDFWRNAGLSLFNRSFDPRVVYDPSCGRWFACAVDGARSGDSRLLVAVSATSNPLQGWSAFGIDADAANVRWADFPVLGVDGSVLAIGHNSFAITSGSVNTTVDILTIPKAALLADPPTIDRAVLIEDIDPNITGFTPHPVTDFTGSGLPTRIFSNYATDQGVLSSTELTGVPFGTTIGPSEYFSAAPFNSPIDAPQAPGPNQRAPVDTGDTRFSSSVIRAAGFVWAVQTVDNGGVSAIRWLRFSNDGLTLESSGLIADPRLNFFYPSIAVNDQGEILVGCSGVDATRFVSAFAIPGLSTATSVTFGEPILLAEGVDDYERLDGAGRNRWGDYSATTVDPNDESTFWTIQEFVVADNIWGTIIAQVSVDSGAPCPADFNGDTTPGDIFDLFDFLAALDGGLDFNGDTSPADIFDLFDFLGVLDAGCP